MNPSPIDPATSVIDAARDALTVQKVFGDAYEHEGTLVIPVAKLWGNTATARGSGAGRFGSDQHGDSDNGSAVKPSSTKGSAGGGGLAVRIKPMGVYVIDERGTRWQPALDLNRAILGGQTVAIVIAAVLGWALGRRWRAASLLRRG